MVTTSTTHLAGVIGANRAAIAADKSNAQVVFRASATAHDAVASTVNLGQYRVRSTSRHPWAGTATPLVRSSTT